jgi:4-hydroxy-tetrahydrodipicolinate synthase
MNIMKPLRGVITAMVTPLSEPNVLDLLGTERLVEHLIAGGVHGLFLLGTTGEAPALSHELREEFVRFTCKCVAARVAVVVGITDTSFFEAVKLARVANESGAQAVVAAPPYYFQLSQEDLLRYFVTLANAVPLPLLLYNAPSNTHHTIGVNTVFRAAEVENIVGIKDSGFRMGYFHEICQLQSRRADFSCLVGPEELMAEAVLLGGHGSMAAGSNVFPELFVELYESAVAGDVERTKEMHRRVLRFGNSVYHSAAYDANPLRGLKCALSLLGICKEVLTNPFQQYSAEERRSVRKYLQEETAKALV